jgi:hypothetical protein
LALHSEYVFSKHRIVSADKDVIVSGSFAIPDFPAVAQIITSPRGPPFSV